MSGFIVGADRDQATLFPESLDDYVAEENAVRVIDVFVDELDLLSLGFKTMPADTGRPGYHLAKSLTMRPVGCSEDRGAQQERATEYGRPEDDDDSGE